jgi:hypothetical protein
MKIRFPTKIYSIDFFSLKLSEHKAVAIGRGRGVDDTPENIFSEK